MTSETDLSPSWRGLVDDAAVFPPGSAELGSALSAYVERTGPARDLVASFVITDQDLPAVVEHVDPARVRASVVVTGGAGAIAGACRLAAKGTTLHALEIALRDLDDLTGNAHRVVAAVEDARAEGLLGEDVPVFVELPQAETTSDWLHAADEVAAAELRLKFRTGGVEAHLFPTAYQLASWIDAALDRELPFKCTAGLHHAIAHRDHDTGFAHHGFLNLLVATEALFDGSDTHEAQRLLGLDRADTLLAEIGDARLDRARRWFTSFGSCSVNDPLDDLTRLGLLEDAQ